MTPRHYPARSCHWCGARGGEPCRTSAGKVAQRMHSDRTRADRHGNRIATEGVTRCWCGCKYWEHDRCTDCGEDAARLLRADPTNC